MSARSTRRAHANKARRILRERITENRVNASLKRGRSLATHLFAAGVNPEIARAVANALRQVAKRLGIAPVKVDRTRNTVGTRNGRLRPVGHYTAAQVQTLNAAYKPRKVEYKAAQHALAA